jgi:predicted RND superfamily exporter protein
MRGAGPHRLTDDRISRVLARIVAARLPVLVAAALLVPAAAYRATRIPNEGGIDRLIAPSDPDYAATRAFQRLFPEPQVVLVLLESADPWSPGAVARLEAARQALRDVPHVTTFSVLEVLRRVRPQADVAELRRLALGTAFFRRQGLVGDHFLTLVVDLDVHGPAERDAAVAAVETRLRDPAVGPVRMIGSPLVTAWLEHQSSAASARAFPVFAVLLVGIVLFLFRSWRALVAIALSLGAAVALGVAAGGVLGFTFTIVSVLVPLTILVTTLASLVYVHSRFVDQPEGVPLAEHHLFALRNKFLPVTASMLAAAVGFAALAVSRIRPIREMGLWTATGLVIAWVVAFTVFPALQRVLRAPTGRSVPVREALYDRITAALPSFTYRHRWALAASGLAVCVAGAAALFGVPGLARGMSVNVDTLEYLDPSTALHRDLVWFRQNARDLNVAHVWVHLPGPVATDPATLQAVDRLEDALAAVPDVTAVTGPTTPLRLRRHLTGHGEALPAEPQEFAAAVADVEQLLLRGDLGGFIHPGLSDLQLTVQFGHGDASGYEALSRRVADAWSAIQAREPSLRGAELHVVGQALLQAKVGAALVPTLAESFLLTVALIFTVFLFLFRSGLERLQAMIPSLFALLATFLGMRLLGGSLNVATIIIATTIVGTTENDQIHFFHHMHEREGDLEGRLRHALRVSGRAILYATLINAAGFVGLAVSTFPPLRQFGVISSAAFLLALVADFTALPAGLWITSRDRPRSERRRPP